MIYLNFLSKCRKLVKLFGEMARIITETVKKNSNQVKSIFLHAA